MFPESEHQIRTPPPEQDRTNRVYSRNAWIYDLLDAPMEWMIARRHRADLVEDLGGRLVLEIGVGTGKNLPWYPQDVRVVAIEPSDGMRRRAMERAEKLGLRNVEIITGDVQALDFPEGHFDAAVATFVFCSVADPLRGLKEVLRVLKPGGELRLIEHQRPRQGWLAWLFDLLNPLVVCLIGANINRMTDENVRKAGFRDVVSSPLDALGVVREIRARKPGGMQHDAGSGG